MNESDPRMVIVYAIAAFLFTAGFLAGVFVTVVCF